MTDLDEVVAAFKANHGFSDESWLLYRDAQDQMQALEREVTALRQRVERAERALAEIRESSQELADAWQDEGVHSDGFVFALNNVLRLGGVD